MAHIMKRFSIPLSALAFSLIPVCRCPASRFSFHPKARICINVSPKQQYSEQKDLSLTEEEMLTRARFLATQFCGTESEMHHFLTKNQQLLTVRKEKFYCVTELLTQHGIEKKELFRYPNVYRRQFKTLISRFKQLEDDGVRPVTLQMMNITYEKKRETKHDRLKCEAETSEMFQNGVKLLSLELGLTKSQAEVIVKKTLPLNNKTLSRLKEKIELLKSYGISSEAIQDRIWMLDYGASTIRSRLEDLKQSGVAFQNFPKSYLVAITSSDELHRKVQERLLKDKAILDESGCSDKEAYFCFRMSCSRTHLKRIIQKCPQVMAIGLPKLKNNLDLILDEFELPPSLILDCPIVLRFSTETLKKRLEQLRVLKGRISGSILTLSSERYKNYISQLLIL